MDATIQPIGPADYELHLTEQADALRPKLDAALKQYRGRVQMRGFRAGKVPMQLVRKLYGKEIAFEIAEKEVQFAFEEEVLDNPEYKVIGRPVMTELAYDGDSDLTATIRFGVRPAIELSDLSGVTITRLVHDVTDEEIDEEIETLRDRLATTEPAADDEIGDDHALTLDLQQLDEESGTPIVGKKEEGIAVRMSDPNLKDELRAALLGKKQGDVFQVELPHGDDEHAHTHTYEVTIHTVERRSLPDADDALAQKVSNGKIDTLDALRTDIRTELEKSWKQRQTDYTETQIVEKLSDLHPVPVPQSALDIYLDSFVQRLKDKQAENGQELPPHFDEAGFRRAMQPEAMRQARWMLIRDHLMEEENIEVTSEDLDAYFADMGGDGLDPQILRRYYEQMDGVMEQLEQKMASERLFEKLGERFQYEDKDMEAVEAEMRERQQARDAALEAEDAALAELNAAADNAPDAASDTDETAPADEIGAASEAEEPAK